MAKAIKGQTAAVKEAEAAQASAAEALKDAVTGTLTLGSVEVDDGGKPVDTKTLTITKGKDAKDAVRYSAACDGASGAVKGTIAAAINDLLINGLKLLPAVWAVPKNEKEVRFPEKGDNKPKDPETLDDLSPAVQDEMWQEMTSLSQDVAEYRDAESRTRASVRKLATRVRDIRVKYGKAEFGIFCKLAVAGGEVAKLLTAKNTLGEFVFFANIPEVLFDLLPSGKASPKSAQAWVNGLRGNVAGAIVSAIKTNADLQALGVSEAVRKVTADHFNGYEVQAFDEDGEAHVVLWDLHATSIIALEGAFFDVTGDGKLAPARDDEGKHVTASLFGSEGADELVKAIANAFNGYMSAAEREAVTEARAKTKPLVSRDFNTLAPDEVARHIFNILAGRIDEGSEESLAATVGDCLAVVDKLGGWLDAVAAGTMTVADVLATGEKPADDEEVEENADADA